MADEHFVIDGMHVIVHYGESRDEAINRTRVEHDAQLRDKQIALRKAEADRLNGRN